MTTNTISRCAFGLLAFLVSITAPKAQSDDTYGTRSKPQPTESKGISPSSQRSYTNNTYTDDYSTAEVDPKLVTYYKDRARAASTRLSTRVPYTPVELPSYAQDYGTTPTDPSIIAAYKRRAQETAERYKTTSSATTTSSVPPAKASKATTTDAAAASSAQNPRYIVVNQPRPAPRTSINIGLDAGLGGWGDPWYNSWYDPWGVAYWGRNTLGGWGWRNPPPRRWRSRGGRQRGSRRSKASRGSSRRGGRRDRGR